MLLGNESGDFTSAFPTTCLPSDRRGKPKRDGFEVKVAKHPVAAMFFQAARRDKRLPRQYLRFAGFE
jgi:hypothetical protein